MDSSLHAFFPFEGEKVGAVGGWTLRRAILTDKPNPRLITQPPKPEPHFSFVLYFQDRRFWSSPVQLTEELMDLWSA